MGNAFLAVFGDTKSLEAADFKALRIGGRDKDRTCDPYDVNVVLSR